ncbi:histidine kinase [Staphylococcus aureus]
MKVKKIIEDERQRLAEELHHSVSQQLFAAKYDAFCYQRNEVRTTIRPTISILEKMVQDSQLEMRALLLHLRPLGLKRTNFFK